MQAFVTARVGDFSRFDVIKFSTKTDATAAYGVSSPTRCARRLGKQQLASKEWEFESTAKGLFDYAWHSA